MIRNASGKTFARLPNTKMLSPFSKVPKLSKRVILSEAWLNTVDGTSKIKANAMTINGLFTKIRNSGIRT